MEQANSTWSTSFSAHPFHGSWERLVRLADDPALVADITGTQLADVVRLRKAIGYLSGLIDSLDPELVPRSIWAGSHSHAEAVINQVTAYSANRSEGNLIAANENLDVLIDTLTRYGSEDAKRRGVAVVAQRVDDQLSSLTKRTVETARSFHLEIEEARRAASEELSAIRKARSRAADYRSKLLDGTTDEPSIQSRIGAFVAEASSKVQEIKEFHASLIVGTAKEESTQAQIKSAASKIAEAQVKITSMLSSVSSETDDLKAFHTKVFGDGEKEVGLKTELEGRLVALAAYEEQQRLRHKTLSDQVEELLPGAASAGLASAFRTMREGFSAPIATYTKVFYASIGLMLFIAVAASVESVSFSPPALTLSHSKDWSDTLRRILERAPLLLPLVWLAIFSGTRRSQYERLQQEYAHKQALASSYESYKRQLTALGGDSEALLKQLIASAIETVAFNASSTLDGRHDQSPPILKFLEKLSLPELEKLLESLRNLKKA